MASLMTCYQRLAIAVLEKALIDAYSRNENLRRTARYFIESDCSSLSLWCKVAGISPSRVRRAAKHPPAMRWPRPGNRFSQDEADA